MALVVVTGGSRSGKSFAAQILAQDARRGRRVVVAVFGKRSDSEMAARAADHRDARPAGFETLEVDRPLGFNDEVPEDALLVVDCLGTALGSLMESHWPSGSGTLADAAPDSLPDGFAEGVKADLDRIVDSVSNRAGDTIIVTNEVGGGLVSAWASGRLFADLLGAANRRLVAAADVAYLAVCGHLIDLKAFPDRAVWPSD